MTQQEWNTYTSAMVGADIVDQNIATRTEVPLQSIVEDKILKLDERVASKFNSMPTQDRSKEFAVRNEGILNNLKGLANYLLPQAYELEKYKYDPTTQTTALLNEDTNQPIVNGTFNKQGYFNSVSSADIDSPFSGTRVNNIDALETHVSTDPNSKYQKIKKEGGYSDAQMLEFMGNDPKAQADFQAAHPGYEFTKTGVKDYSGNRDIIQGKEYSDYMLSTGQAVPGRDATEADRLLNKQAKEQKLGNYATENGTRLMDSNAIYNQFDSDKGKHDNSILGRTANIGKAFGTAVGGQVVDLADLAVTAFGGDLGTAEEKDKYVKEFFGYDSHWDERAQAVAGQAIDRMQKFGVNTNDVGDILGTAISNPEMFGTSLGYVVPMLASGPISAIGKAAKAVEASEAALKASKLTGTALELQAASHAKLVAGAEQTMAKLSGSSIAVDAGLSIPQRAAAIKDQYTNMARATDYLSKNAGIFAFSAGKTNDDIEARIKNNEGVDDTGMLGKAGMYFGNVIYNKLDVWADMGILKSPEVLNGVKLMAKSMNAGDLVKTAEGVVKTAAYTGVNLAKEGTTEAAQEIMDIISTEYKTKTHGEDLGELLKNEQDRILLSGAMGVAGATQFTGVNLAAVGIKETPEAFKKGIELATETPLQKDLRQLREYSTPLQDEAVTAAATGDYQTVVNKVEEAHGKLVDDLDPSATKGRTYAVLLNKAMESALRAGDSVALDNVYKTMKELHNDKNVEFDIRDVVHKDASKIAQEFVQLINSGTKDTEDVAAKFRGEVGKEAEKQISILEEVKELRKRAEIKAAKMKSVMGTDLEDSVTKEIDELNATIDGYLANPTLEKTNQQIAKLGYLILDPEKGIVSDPSRPGLAVYEEALTEQLLNPKTNKSLLAKELKGTAGASVEGGSTVRLQGLTEFAKSRTDKLMPRKERSAVQTDKIMDNMLIENAQMGRVIDNVLATASGLTGKGLDADTKQSYIDELNTAKGYVETANKQLNDRKAILSTVTKPEGLAGALAFHVDAKTGNESIQVMNKVDDKWTYTKIADVIDGKVVMLDEYTKTAVKPTPVVDKVMTGDKFKEEYVRRVKKIIKDKAGKPEELTLEEEQLLANAAEDGILQQANKELANEINDVPATKIMRNDSIIDKTPNKEDMEYEASQKMEKATEPTAPVTKGPLDAVRAKVAQLDKVLNETISKVPDMLVKQYVKEHYNKKLAEVQADKSKLNDMLNRYEALITKRQDKSYTKEDGVVLSALKMTMDKLLTKMIDAVRKLKNLLKGKNAEYSKLETELKELLSMINEVEKPIERKTTIGKVKVIDEGVYGTSIVEVGEKRVVAEKRISEKTGKEVSQQTAINDAVNALADEKIVELRDELKSTEKGKTSLGAKLLGRLLTNYPMQSAVHDIIKRTDDSVFGQIKGNTFADTKLLLDTLPKGFKDFFTSRDGSKELLEDFDVMKTYIAKTTIGDILINKDSRVYSTSSNKSNTNKYGLIMKNVISAKDGKEYNFPVDIIELIGTVKDGKLEIDEQTQNILKFYSAKLLTDTQRMVGLILSMDESEMGQILGIYDADEQLQVKQDAREGYINSASVRGDIGQEVYQALGIKFNSTTPEFTEESFKTALGVLVQAITVENSSMQMKSTKEGKNRNLIKTNWENVPAERNSLMRAMSKLQYMNENRSRPLPNTKKPADSTGRTVMNTKNPIDKKSNEFINAQEKIAYTISPEFNKWLELDEKDALKAMGFIDIELADLHASEIDAVLARNDKLVREWNILKAFANGLGDKKFYLNWGQTVSGRFTILNDINYQESKLHREFVVAEGSTIEVDPKSEDDRQMLEASILQGLDMDPDKLSAKTASANFNKLFKVTDKGIEVTEDSAIKEAYDAMKEGKFNAEAMAEIFADSEGHHGLSSIELLVQWDKAIRSGNKIKTHANLEIDAITSGMILTLLQIGSDEAIQLAEKGGIYTKAGKEARTAYVKKWLEDDVEFTPGALIEAGKKHAAEIEAKMKTAKGTELVALRKELEDDAVFKDLYSTIGVAMIGEVQAYENKLKAKEKKTDAEVQQLAMLEQIGELNLKNIRSIAKSPVMVFIYGATVTSIKKKLTYSLGVDTLVKAMKTASKLVKEGKDATKELEFIKQFEPVKGWNYTDGLGGKIDKPVELWKQLLYTDISPEVIETIDKVINSTFGTAIETAFESRLGFVNRNRDAIKTVEVLMFEAYQIRLSDAVTELLDSKYGKGKHKGETYKISKDELQDINAKLTEQGYGHNIVWNDTDGSVVNQTLNKTGEKGGNYTARVQVGDIKVGGQIKESKPVVNTGAAPTISIHAIDGRMMLDVLNRKVKGYTGGNVYDAVVLSLDKAMLNDTANTYNTNMIETGFSRSILADQLATLENMLSTITDEQKKLMFTNIGLRPEGTLREDYTKEVNRLKLGTGKMLELLEIAEMVNAERLANSANGYSVGHLFQMGAGIVDVEASEIRAKELPAIDTIKRLLENKHAQDRKVTEKEFGVKADYVFNTNDIAKGETQIQSKANIVQVSTGEYIKLADKLWDSLSSKDIVAIIGEYIVPEKADNKSRAYSKVINGILKSNAGIVAAGMDEQLENSGRTLVDGIWVKEIKVEEQQKQEVDIIQPSEVFTNNINKNMKC